MRNVRLTVLALVVSCVLGACSGEPDAPAVETPATPSTSAEQRARYAVDLELVEQAPASPGGSTSPSTTEPGEPLVLSVTNTGKRPDSYLLRLLPPVGGGVVPETLDLAPGEQQLVRLLLTPVAVSGEMPFEVVAVSRGRGDVVATLELPD